LIWLLFLFTLQRDDAIDLDFSTFLEYYFRWQYLVRRLSPPTYEARL